MLSDRQIRKLSQKIYPSSVFSRKERKHLRQAIAEEIKIYLEEHPDVTYENVQQHFTDVVFSANQQEKQHSHTTKIILCIILVIIVLCAIFYSISNNWLPPSYTV